MNRKILFLFTICTLLASSNNLCAQNITDSVVKQESIKTTSDTLKQHKRIFNRDSITQIRIGLDVSRLIFNQLYPSRKGYELQADYFWKKNLYLAAEGGFGSGSVNYSFLKYHTNGAFIRIGVEQTLLHPLSNRDFDNAFVGIRYGMGFGRMSDADFTVPSLFGGETVGTVSGQNYFVHWGELVAGIKVGIWKNLYAGWTARGKFLFNPKAFKQLSPNYIPGFGKGDKNTVFDFNFYLSYGIVF